mmetsp:Transcript_1698/g.3186  ORF Transcript_1698/g.3186 Transcript_1698/m.3186 type:complete len:129 (+) Transcript_1698:2172-2558(+)
MNVTILCVHENSIIGEESYNIIKTISRTKTLLPHIQDEHPRDTRCASFSLFTCFMSNNSISPMSPAYHPNEQAPPSDHSAVAACRPWPDMDSYSRPPHMHWRIGNDGDDDDADVEMLRSAWSDLDVLL